MRRRDLLKLFKKNGWWIAREGSDHTVLTNGRDIEPIPRHNEIKEALAKALIKKRALK